MEGRFANMKFADLSNLGLPNSITGSLCNRISMDPYEFYILFDSEWSLKVNGKIDLFYEGRLINHDFKLGGYSPEFIPQVLILSEVTNISYREFSIRILFGDSWIEFFTCGDGYESLVLVVPGSGIFSIT